MNDEILENEKSTKKTSSFLLKLYNILENREYDDIIRWSSSGNSFIVKNLNEFTEKVIPKHFKHSNFSSFVRQLNMYDFHKTKTSLNESQFSHKLFSRGRIEMLKGIKRKTNNQVDTEKNNLEKMSLDKFFSERWIDNKKLTKKNYERINIILLKNLEDMKVKQRNLETKIDYLSQKNMEYISQHQNILQEIIKKSEYAKKLESMLILIMEMIFPNKTSQIMEKMNLQSANSTNALPVNEFNILKSAEKNDNLIVLRSFFEKLMEQPKPIDLPINKVRKHSIAENPNQQNNCLVLANNGSRHHQINYENSSHNNNYISSNMSIKSSNHSNVSQLINNIEEGLENKRKMSSPSPFHDEMIFGQGDLNSPYISRIECDRFSGREADEKEYMGKKTFRRDSFEFSNDLFRMESRDDDNIQITDQSREIVPSYSNAIQIFKK